MAVRRCPVEEGVTIFHSDRGSQYTSQKFLDHLKGYGIRPSVGRTGVCWDNAWASVVQRHAQERESPPNGVSHEGQGNKRYCLMDRAEIQSCPPSLSPRVSHPERGRTRFPGPEEGSLKHKQALSEKHLADHPRITSLTSQTGLAAPLSGTSPLTQAKTASALL